jgi:hypothetical protein
MDLLKHDNFDELITAVYDMVETSTVLEKPVDAPRITRELFAIDETIVARLLSTPEFTAVCEAVDHLINEGTVYFDCADGSLYRV